MRTDVFRLHKALPILLFIVCCTGPWLNNLRAQPKIEAEVVAFTYHGFNPARIARRPGPFQLGIHNTTRQPSLEFTLENSHGDAVQGGIHLGTAAGRSYRQVFDLGVGTYTLRIKELPSQTMTIVISASGN